eukprot:scaffold33779_cov50-Prasinocladus_malaysianus.AAC.2
MLKIAAFPPPVACSLAIPVSRGIPGHVGRVRGLLPGDRGRPAIAAGDSVWERGRPPGCPQLVAGALGGADPPLLPTPQASGLSLSRPHLRLPARLINPGVAEAKHIISRRKI